MLIRHAVAEDFLDITDILNHYILNSDARYFESEPVSLELRTPWLLRFDKDSPHQLLVSEQDGVISGFCCSQPYRPEPAYRKTIETSIYTSPHSVSKGVGSALYERLFREMAKHDLHRALAGIVLPNGASTALHRKFGFAEIGVFNEYGMKDDRYISSAWMEKRLLTV